MSDVNQAHLKKLEPLPEGWADSSVSEIVQMISANNKKLAQKNYLEDGEFPVIDQGQDFVGGYSNDKSLVIDEEPPFIVFGDHTRAFKFANFQFVPGADGVKIMKPLGVDPKWCFYIFQAIKLPNKGYARHFQYLKEAYVPVPPPEQQKRIVAKIEELFSHIDAGIGALKKAKQLLKQYRQSVLKAAVTGELTKEWREANSRSLAFDWLEQIAELRESLVAEGFIAKPKKTTVINENDLPYQIPRSWEWVRLDDFVLTSVDCPHSTAKYKEQGKKCVRTADFLPGRLVMDNVRCVTPEAFDERNKRLVPKPGDVLYSREGGILGIACMIPEGEELCLGQRMMIFRTESKIASTYLMHNLNSPLIVHRVKSLTGGSASPHLNVGEIRNFLLPIPPKQECEALLSALDEKLSSIERLENEIDSQLVKAEKNKQPVLAAAFGGKLIQSVMIDG